MRRLPRHFAGEPEAEKLLKRRFALINVWRPITTIEQNPLAVCDPATVNRADLNLVPLYTSSTGTTFDPPLVGMAASFNPAHRFYYFPRLEPTIFRL